jgi:flavorubredoxin
MKPQKIAENIFWVGVIDKESKFFDQLMPLPEGTSYNAYLIKGSEKTALIETVAPEFTQKLLENLKSCDVQKIDYIVANHAEQDHTGALKEVMRKYPEAKVVCNQKCFSFLEQEHHITKVDCIIIEDKQRLSLGDKTLEFLFAPWVHWPETMFTYVQEEKILFPCDLFGAHLAFEELWVKNKEQIENSAKRYYAEIMMPFVKMVSKNQEMLKKYPLSIIAPSHGPIYNNPSIILDLYKEWTGNNIKQKTVIAYVSMHGSTKRMAEHLEWKAKEQGMQAVSYNIMETEVGTIAMNLINTSTFIICSPAYLGGLHPAAANLLFIINGFRPNIKQYTIIGSYGWEAKFGEEGVKRMLSSTQAEFLPPIIIQGFPKDEDFKKIDNLVALIKEKQQN